MSHVLVRGISEKRQGRWVMVGEGLELEVIFHPYDFQGPEVCSGGASNTIEMGGK